MSDAAANHLPKVSISSTNGRCSSAGCNELSGTYLSAFTGGTASPILGNPSQSLPCSCGAITDGHECRCSSGSTPLPMQETLILPLGVEQPPVVNRVPSDPESPSAVVDPLASIPTCGPVDSLQQLPSTAESLQQHAAHPHQHGAVFAGAAALAVPNGREAAAAAPAAGAAAADSACEPGKAADGESSCPPFAVKSTCGKRSNQEDTYALCPNICELPMSPMAVECADKFPHRIAMQLNSSTLHPYMTAASAATSASGEGEAAPCGTAAAVAASARLERFTGSSSSSGSTCVEQLHFFGVYDGHGGTEASLHCAQRLHHHLSEALLQIGTVWCESNQFVSCIDHDQTTSWDEGEMLSPEANGGERTLGSISTGSGSNSSSSQGDGGEGDGSAGSGSDDNCSDATYNGISCMMEQALRTAFLKTDEEFSGDNTAGLVGSTAVVALVGTHRVWIANCGDSRAVLSRNGLAIQVTDDHKPEREDEAERVEKAGGQVLYWNGHRVMGVLAMSRAIGDHCLRPYVIPEPEISVFARHAKDEIMLLASDGLWDVMTNQEATDLALRAIRRAHSKGASKKAAARVAATVLTKAAMDRGSRDNITVVIIDLSRSASSPVASAAQGPASSRQSAGGLRAASTPAAAAAAPVSEPVGSTGLQRTAAAAAGVLSPPRACSSSGGGSRTSCDGGPFGAAAASPFQGGDSAAGPGAGGARASSSGVGSRQGSRMSSHAGQHSAFLDAAGVAGEDGAAAAGDAQDPTARGSSALLDSGHANSLAQELQDLDLRATTAANVQEFATAVATGAAGEGGRVLSGELRQQLTMVAPPPASGTAVSAAAGARA